MRARQNPGFIGHARSIRTKSDIIATNLHDPLVLAFFLRDDVAEDAAFFLVEIIAAGAQLVKDAAGNERSAGQFHGRMLKFLSGGDAVVLVNADVLETLVA